MLNFLMYLKETMNILQHVASKDHGLDKFRLRILRPGFIDRLERRLAKVAYKDLGKTPDYRSQFAASLYVWEGCVSLLSMLSFAILH